MVIIENIKKGDYISQVTVNPITEVRTIKSKNLIVDEMKDLNFKIGDFISEPTCYPMELKQFSLIRLLVKFMPRLRGKA